MKNIWFHIHGKRIFKAVLLSAGLFAQNLAFAAGPPAKPDLYNPLALILLSVILCLLLVIALLANIVVSMGQLYVKRLKTERIANKNTENAKIVTALLFCLLTIPGISQEVVNEQVAARVTHISGLPIGSFYVLLGVIGLELIILFVLVYFLKIFMAVEKQVAVESVSKPVFSKAGFKNWWEKINNFRPAKEEAEIELEHSYDGITELDNRLPPWWLYGFYLTIFVGCIYLWRYHVSHSGLSSKQEYELAVEKAEKEKAIYLAKSAGNVDENTVKLLTDATALESGKKLYASNCAACHGADGGGVVGPNLTDDYWLHGGSLKEVFISIKYGWPEKGMKSWKDDFSPVQIAELTSYVKSLHGTKVAAPKEPQGEKYEEAPSEPALKDTLQALR